LPIIFFEFVLWMQRLVCIFVKYNGVSFIGGNCKKSPMNIMFIPPNGNILGFNFCNFKCIVTIILQPTIEISSIIINSIVGQIFTIQFNLFTMACLSMDKPNIEQIIVPPTNNVAFAMYAPMQSFCSLFFLFKLFFIFYIIILTF
jgi:hypothetical protein